MVIEIINTILGTLTLIIHVIVVLYFLLYFIRKDLLKQINTYVKDYGIEFSLIITITAIVSSLYYSNIVGFEPCTLCWYQRIFIYPQAILLSVALFRKEKTIIPYSITLAVISSLISAYHYIVQRITDFNSQVSLATPCTLAGNCTSKFVFEYGYITIPLMALTVGISILLLLMISKKK